MPKNRKTFSDFKFIAKNFNKKNFNRGYQI